MSGTQAAIPDTWAVMTISLDHVTADPTAGAGAPLEKTRIAGRGTRSWIGTAPVFAGDRLSAHVEVTDKRLTNKGDRGILTLRITATNQRRALVQDGTNLLLVRTRRACEQTRNA